MTRRSRASRISGTIAAKKLVGGPSHAWTARMFETYRSRLMLRMIDTSWRKRAGVRSALQGQGLSLSSARLSGPRDEKLPAPLLHLVERHHARHPVLDLAQGANSSATIRSAIAIFARAAVRSTKLGFERRWVIYNGVADALQSDARTGTAGCITPSTCRPRTNLRAAREKPHIPNMTGTPAAYRPPGSTLGRGKRPRVTGDYQAWKPGE